MKKLLEKIWTIIKRIWILIKNWFLETALPWLKTGWLQLVNIIVIIVAYAGFNEYTQPGFSLVIGAWFFLLLVYYLFWKLFGLDKVWKKFKGQ